jgi:NADPH2:quinone reductase
VFGRLVVIGFAAGSIAQLPANQVLLKNRTIVGVDWGAWAMQHAASQAVVLDEVLDAVRMGELHPEPPAQRPLAEAGAVLRDLLDRRLQGKTVLVP